MFKSKIAGLGHYIPENLVTNEDLAKAMDTNDAWITERTGIKTRYFFTEGKDTVSSMAAEASKKALSMAGITPRELDCVIFATLTPDYYFPGCGVLLLRHLGIAEIPAFDIRQQCAGFLYALQMADQFIKTGLYKNVLVACGEIQSNVMEQSDRGRNMAVIFGDGAGCVVLTRTEEEGKGILTTHVHADGNFAEELMCRLPSSSLKKRFTHEMLEDGSLLPHMNGNLVFKHAIVRFEEAVMEALNACGKQISDIDLLIPHQANLRISQFLQNRLKLPDHKVYNNIQNYGNTTAASIPLAMSEAWEKGILHKDMTLCVAAFGSGFVWGSALIRF